VLVWITTRRRYSCWARRFTQCYAECTARPIRPKPWAQGKHPRFAAREFEKVDEKPRVAPSVAPGALGAGCAGARMA